MNLKALAKERDEAILSLDKKKILSYMKKYGIQPASNDKVFWAGIHKAMLQIKASSEEQKENSKKWLIENGFNPGIGDKL